MVQILSARHDTVYSGLIFLLGTGTISSSFSRTIDEFRENDLCRKGELNVTLHRLVERDRKERSSKDFYTRSLGSGLYKSPFPIMNSRLCILSRSLIGPLSFFRSHVSGRLHVPHPPSRKVSEQTLDDIRN